MYLISIWPKEQWPCDLPYYSYSKGMSYWPFGETHKNQFNGQTQSRIIDKWCPLQLHLDEMIIRSTLGWMDWCSNAWVCTCVCMRSCMCVCMDGWMDVQMHVCVYEWMDVRCTNRRMDESANGWIVVSSDRQMSNSQKVVPKMWQRG